MNKVELVGRLTRKPDIMQTASTTITRFTLAVNRRFKNSEGKYEADFISCVAFGKTAEFIGKFFDKGSAMGAVGRIQTGNYTKEDGTRVYTTDVVVEETYFIEKSSSSNEASNKEETPSDDGFLEVEDSELPFN